MRCTIDVTSIVNPKLENHKIGKKWETSTETFLEVGRGLGHDGWVCVGISVALADASIAENYAAETSIALKGWAQIEKGWAEDCLLCRYKADNRR